MSGNLVFWVPDFGLVTERLTLTEPCDFVDGVRVPERRVFMVRVLLVRKTVNYTNLDAKGSTRVLMCWQPIHRAGPRSISATSLRPRTQCPYPLEFHKQFEKCARRKA